MRRRHALDPIAAACDERQAGAAAEQVATERQAESGRPSRNRDPQAVEDPVWRAGVGERRASG
jgi:hypothetical protein